MYISKLTYTEEAIKTHSIALFIIKQEKKLNKSIVFFNNFLQFN